MKLSDLSLICKNEVKNSDLNITSCIDSFTDHCVIGSPACTGHKHWNHWTMITNTERSRQQIDKHTVTTVLSCNNLSINWLINWFKEVFDNWLIFQNFKQKCQYLTFLGPSGYILTLCYCNASCRTFLKQKQLIKKVCVQFSVRL